MWTSQAVALFLLNSASSLDVVDVVAVAESWLALVQYCCCHPSLDFGGSSMQGCTCSSKGYCSFGSYSHSWLARLKEM